jgi:hypothetical protein
LNDSALTRFFGVVVRPRTWLGVVFHLLAFPLGLVYFVFLVTGLSVGVSLVVIWVGIPILLVVAGAWWLLAAFERVQARYLLGAEVPPAPRPWERADGVWGKLKAHFGSGSTWRDLAYLITKLAFGTMSFSLLVVLASVVGSFLAMPFFAAFDVPIVNGTWVPPLWFGILSVPLGILMLILSLHLLNAWGWVCARWAEVMFRVATPGGQPVPVTLPQPDPLARPELLAWPGRAAPQATLAAPAPQPPAPADSPAGPPAPAMSPARPEPAQPAVETVTEAPLAEPPVAADDETAG